MIIREDVLINSTKEKVWSAFTDLTCWVNWNTVLRGVYSREKLLTEGESLRCTLRPFFFPVMVDLLIEEVVPQERIVWVARKKGLKARHEFLFEDGGNGVRVISRETFTGFLSALSGLLLPVGRMTTLTKVFLSDLKKAAEQ
jgi:hypothetical protein